MKRREQKFAKIVRATRVCASGLLATKSQKESFSHPAKWGTQVFLKKQFFFLVWTLRVIYKCNVLR